MRQKNRMGEKIDGQLFLKLMFHKLVLLFPREIFSMSKDCFIFHSIHVGLPLPLLPRLHIN